MDDDQGGQHGFDFLDGANHFRKSVVNSSQQLWIYRGHLHFLEGLNTPWRAVKQFPISCGCFPGFLESFMLHAHGGQKILAILLTFFRSSLVNLIERLGKWEGDATILIPDREQLVWFVG